MRTGELAMAWLLSRPAPVWVVVDAAADSGLPDFLQLEVTGGVSLFSGLDAVLLAEVAPFLVPLAGNAALQNKIIENWSGLSWLFIEAQVARDDLRLQLKKNLMLKLNSRRSVYFRFYDWRALAPFLAVADTEQLAHFFGAALVAVHGSTNDGAAMVSCHALHAGAKDGMGGMGGVGGVGVRDGIAAGDGGWQFVRSVTELS